MLRLLDDPNRRLQLGKRRVFRRHSTQMLECLLVVAPAIERQSEIEARGGEGWGRQSRKGLRQPRHLGEVKNLTKFLIYLNEDLENPNSGGTVFFNKKKTTAAVIKREKYKAALFDMRQLHTGGQLVKGIKYLFGARLMYVKD